MSRGGAAVKRQVESGFTDKIPLKPEAVVAYELEQKERKLWMLYAACRTAAWKGHFPLFRSPEALGAAHADNLMNQVMQQMIERQPQIVVPPTKVVVPR